MVWFSKMLVWRQTNGRVGSRGSWWGRGWVAGSRWWVGENGSPRSCVGCCHWWNPNCYWGSRCYPPSAALKGETDKDRETVRAQQLCFHSWQEEAASLKHLHSSRPHDGLVTCPGRSLPLQQEEEEWVWCTIQYCTSLILDQVTSQSNTPHVHVKMLLWFWNRSEGLAQSTVRQNPNLQWVKGWFGHRGSDAQLQVPLNENECCHLQINRFRASTYSKLCCCFLHSITLIHLIHHTSHD